MAFVVRKAYGDSRGFDAFWWPTIELHPECADSAVRRAARSLHERCLIDLSYMSDETTRAVRRLQHIRLGHQFGARTESVYRGFPETVDHVVALAAGEVAFRFARDGAKSQDPDRWKEEWKATIRRWESVIRYHRRALRGLGARGRFSPAWAACQVLSSKTTEVGGLTWWQILCGFHDDPFEPKIPGGWACPAISTPEVKTALSHLGVQDDLAGFITRRSKALARIRSEVTGASQL
jgi:hypothetical protein